LPTADPRPLKNSFLLRGLDWEKGQASTNEMGESKEGEGRREDRFVHKGDALSATSTWLLPYTNRGGGVKDCKKGDGLGDGEKWR